MIDRAWKADVKSCDGSLIFDSWWKKRSKW